MDLGQGKFGQMKQRQASAIAAFAAFFTSARGEILEHKMYLTGQRPKAL